MLRFAEDERRRRRMRQLDLGTSELQADALAVQRDAGYLLVREKTATIAGNKTLGGGIRRFHFSKRLQKRV